VRLCSIRRAASLAIVLISAGVLSANSAGAATPHGVSAGSGSRAAGTQGIRPGWVQRSKAILGPVRVARSGGQGFVRRDNAGTVVYDSIVTNARGQISSYIASLGYECCSTDEFGDSLLLTQGGGRLKTIDVVMDSWGCESGDGYGADSCLTTKGATFSWPITANVYSMSGYPGGVPTVGQLIASRTETFKIPYRPSSNTKFCQGPNLGAFVGPVDKECDFGLAHTISFNMSLPKVILPSEVIVTVAFNTSDSGYNPVGDNTACFAAGDCPYDSLNVSAWGNGGVDDSVGSAADPNGVMVNFTNPYFYCSNNPNGEPAGGSLVDDTPCWTGYHPEIKVTTF